MITKLINQNVEYLVLVSNKQGQIFFSSYFFSISLQQQNNRNQGMKLVEAHSFNF